MSLKEWTGNRTLQQEGQVRATKQERMIIFSIMLGIKLKPEGKYHVFGFKNKTVIIYVEPAIDGLHNMKKIQKSKLALRL